MRSLLTIFSVLVGSFCFAQISASVLNSKKGISPFTESVADLAILIEENPTRAALEHFRDSVIIQSPIPIQDLKFQGLVKAYIDWTREPMKLDYRTVATSFRNDTLNQFGMIQYMSHALSNAVIDTATYRRKSDSLFRISANQVISDVLRNQNFKLKISNTFPDFEFELIEGGTYRFSQAQESFLLLEFPLPASHDKIGLSAHHIFKEFGNIKILRVALMHKFLKEQELSGPFAPLNPMLSSIMTTRSINS